jgi:hypothetical protein
MNRFTMKKLAIALLLSASVAPAFATNYYVVVPVPNRTATAGNILVSLNGYGLPQGQVGDAYAGFDFNTVLQVKGDPGFDASSVRWSMASGALPAGLSLGADGKLTGTPTAAGTASFQVLAAYKTKAGQQAYTVTVNNLVVTLASGGLPNGVQGAAYSFDLKSRLSVSGDSAYAGTGVTWSVSSGSMPSGLSLGADGIISGVPTDENAGTPFTVKAAYKTRAGQQVYQVVVGAIVVTLSNTALPAGKQGAAYSFDLSSKLQVTGDAAYAGSAVTWSVVSGSLPAGLTLGANGIISGVPIAESTGTPFTVQAAYKAKDGQQSYQMSVPAIVVSLSATTLPKATNNEAYSFNFSPYVSVTGDAAYGGSGITWSVASGTLPVGLTLDSTTGILSGKPVGATTGTSVTVQAAYKTKTGQYAYSLVVATTPVVLAPTSFASGGTPQALFYEDQTVAASCKAYHAGTANYAAATASGYYWVNMGAGIERAYCDMTTAGGGWTLVARSGGAVVTNATYCNSGISGVNTPFGWSVARGSPSDTSNPYSMGVFTRSLAFSEVLIGDASGTSNSWGAHVFQQPVPANLKTGLTTSDVPLSVAAAFPMAQYMGHTTDTTQYFFRDVPDGTRSQAQAYGLHADGWQTCYGDGPNTLSPQAYPASYGGSINYRHGMLMVR